MYLVDMCFRKYLYDFYILYFIIISNNYRGYCTSREGDIE